MDSYDPIIKFGNDNPGSLIFAHLNIRSLMAPSSFGILSALSKLEEAKLLLMDVLTGQFIYAFSEAFLTREDSDNLLMVYGYDVFRKDQSESLQTNPKGGGLLCYIPTTIKAVRQ